VWETTLYVYISIIRLPHLNTGGWIRVAQE
jgi:hypothetical protein